MIDLKNVSFHYIQSSENSGGLENISLHIHPGECVVFCGESGCGKTTLTRLINGLIPHYYEGELTGQILVKGRDVSRQPLYDTARFVGSVFQNPRSQFFNVDTTSEITFGCENLGLNPQEILSRLEQTTQDFHLHSLTDRDIFHLSGGEKQKIACASVSIMHPDIFVLDEPSSNLDTASVEVLKKILSFWKYQGKTIVISEHRLYYLRGLADRFVCLKDGKIQEIFSASAFSRMTEEERHSMGLRAYCLEQLALPAPCPPGNAHIQLHNFSFTYPDGTDSLRISDCRILAERIVAVVGHNGAGKSTFLRCLCGLEKKCGTVLWNQQSFSPKDRLSLCYMVMQDVNHQLFTESVEEELQISMAENDGRQVEEILEELDLLPLKNRHPMSLSGGQKQRVAIACAVASRRPLLVFDEPTSGLDHRHMLQVAAILRRLCESGKSIYVITHDLELILECCTDILCLSHGQITQQYPLDSLGLQKLKETFFSQEDAS